MDPEHVPVILLGGVFECGQYLRQPIRLDVVTLATSDTVSSASRAAVSGGRECGVSGNKVIFVGVFRGRSAQDRGNR
jgi:hypothetical protein